MRCFALLLLILPSLSSAQQSIPASDLQIDGIYATRAGDPTLYCLLGGNACIVRMPPNPWNKDPFIGNWLIAHPQATAPPISSRNWAFGKGQHMNRVVYLWILDGDDSLNVALVREGRYPAGNMQDQLEANRQQTELLKDPKLADARALLEQERDKIPEEQKPYGSGETCLIVADILYGLLDNGIIKGYVYSPADPQPLVQNLEHWTPEMATATTAYRLIRDNWYVFVVLH